jgi:peptidoglycan LD-endopeptidase CwlK
MSRSLEDLLPPVAALARQFLEECERQGFLVFVTSTLRTFFEQDELFAQGRTKPGDKVTNAEAGESSHNYGLAFDVAFRSPPAADPFDGNPWDEIGAIGKALGLEWGGDWPRFPDRPHFQLPSPVSLQLRKAASTGRLRRGIGAAKANVEELQKALSKAGFDAGAVDGDFGTSTEKAVQALQRAHGLLPDGMVRRQELEILEQALA